MRWRRLRAAGLTVAAAAVAAALIAGGVGSAATTVSRTGGRTLVRGTPPPQPSRAAIKSALTRAASPATDRMYLQITGVSGEVQDGPYSGALSVLSWSWGLSSPPSSSTQASDLNVEVPFDRAVPRLETRAEDHTPLTMELTELASSNQKIREIKLTGAKVDAVQVGSQGDGTVPMVSVSFSYATEQTIYWYANSSGGLTTYTSCWNATSGTDCGS